MIKGDRFNYSFKVTEDIYKGYINLFNDRNPLHTDKDVAKSKGFNDVVMHGNILNGFLSYFIGELLPDKNVMIHTQFIKFFSPVYLNDSLQFHAEITEVHEAVSSVTIKYLFENMQKQKIAKGEIIISKI